MDISLWVKSVFPRIVSSSYFEEFAQNDGKRCLINNPIVTMGHPIIDFDVSGTCDMILESAKDTPDERAKPALGVVRGIGSGKTRCLEEIRRELLKRPGVLPIGITFNAAQNIDSRELEWGKDYKMAFALMVTARCASVLFDVDLYELRNLITKRRSLKKRYENKDEACSVLKEALLGPPALSFSFNTTLCVSSLKLSVIGSTLSGRPVKALGIPSSLNTTRIVREWWKCKREDERLMLFVAACVNTLPRAVEIVNSFLTKHSDRPKNSNFMQDLFVSLKDSLAVRYNWKNFPNYSILFSILYAKNIILSSAVHGLIARSILLNSIESSLKEEREAIIPTSSLTVLAGCTNEDKCPLQIQMINIYKDVLQEIVYLAGNKSRKGIPFESSVASWMKYRWSVACATRKSLTLGEVLGISIESINSVSYEVIKTALSKKITKSCPDASDFQVMNIDSYKDSKRHMKEVCGIKVNSAHP